MAEYDSFYRCTIGTTGLSVVDYSHHEEKVVREGRGFTAGAIGKKIVIAVNAFVTGATPQELQDNLWAAKTALASSGLNFQLWANGLADPQVSILAAALVDNGPHFEFDVAKQGEAGALKKNISFTLTAQTARLGSGGGGQDAQGGVQDLTTYDLKVSAGPDGLTTSTRTGEIRGPNLYDRFQQLLKNFGQIYKPDFFTLSSEYELGTFQEKSSDGTILDQGDVLKYTLTAVENADALPSDGKNPPVDFAVEGTASAHSDRDEQHRMTETFSFDLLVVGDAQKVLTLIRKVVLPPGRVASRETIEITSVKERRLRASFVYLRSADGAGGLMNWTQTFRTTQAANVFEEKQYPGLNPILIKKPKALARLVQSGTAIGDGEFPAPAAPLFADQLLEAPELSYTDLNDVEKQTEWTYTMAVENDATDIDNSLLKRPKGGASAA